MTSRLGIRDVRKSDHEFVEKADEVGIVAVKGPDIPDRRQLVVCHGAKIKNIVDKVN